MTFTVGFTSKITDNELEKKREKELLEGRLQGGEHCFREVLYWYRLNVGYTNPLNFGEVHAELALIKSQMRMGNKSVFRKWCEERQLVFYGIGVGDTEMAFVDWALKEGEQEIDVVGIDVNTDFLKNFEVALKNRTFEPDAQWINITFKEYHSLFEQMYQSDLESTEKINAHICLEEQ